MTKKTFLRWSLTALGCALLSVGFASCKDNDDSYTKPSYSITKDGKNDKTFTVDHNGGNLTLHLQTNRRWEASSTADWISISPASGNAGTFDLTLRVLPNSSPRARRTQVVIKISGIAEAYTIEQTSADNPGGGNNGGQAEATALEDFIKKYDQGKEVTVEEDITLKLTLISDIESNNLTNIKNPVFQAGDHGITVRLKDRAKTEWKPGTIFTIKAKGGKVLRYNGGSLQLDLSAVTDPSAVTPTSEVATIDPKVVTLADIYAEKYDNILIAVEGVQFKTPGKALNPNQPAPGKSTIYTYFNTISDCVTTAPQGVNDLAVAISGYAPEGLRSAIASDKNGRIVGIIQRSVSNNTKHHNIWIRNLKDLDGLQGTRCTEQGGTTPPPTPNPPTPGPASPDLMFVDYVEGTGYEKYIQLYNPTDQEIDLSTYSIVLQPYKGSDGKGNKSKAHEHTLSGKIPAKGFIIFRNSKATKFDTATACDDITSFNGDDPLALKKNGQVIDVIGPFDQAWAKDGKALGMDIFLHRKVSINAPATTFDEAQWDKESIDKANEAKLPELITKYFNKR